MRSFAETSNNADCQERLANWLFKLGREDEGVEWLRKAAEHGLPSAQNDFAHRLENGVGVPRDLSLAVRYRKMAAEAGDPCAMCDWGSMLERGIKAAGVKADLRAAVQWYKKTCALGAKGHGITGAQFRLGMCYDAVGSHATHAAHTHARTHTHTHTHTHRGEELLQTTKRRFDCFDWRAKATLKTPATLRPTITSE